MGERREERQGISSLRKVSEGRRRKGRMKRERREKIYIGKGEYVRERGYL